MYLFFIYGLIMLVHCFVCWCNYVIFKQYLCCIYDVNVLICFGFFLNNLIVCYIVMLFL